MTIGTYGSGPYAVRIETSGPFGTEEVHTQLFENLTEATDYYRRHKVDDGPIAGTCPLRTRTTSRNRTLREAM